MYMYVCIACHRYPHDGFIVTCLLFLFNVPPVQRRSQHPTNRDCGPMDNYFISVESRIIPNIPVIDFLRNPLIYRKCGTHWYTQRLTNCWQRT